MSGAAVGAERGAEAPASPLAPDEWADSLPVVWRAKDHGKGKDKDKMVPGSAARAAGGAAALELVQLPVPSAAALAPGARARFCRGHLVDVEVLVVEISGSRAAVRIGAGDTAELLEVPLDFLAPLVVAGGGVGGGR